MSTSPDSTPAQQRADVHHAAAVSTTDAGSASPSAAALAPDESSGANVSPLHPDDFEVLNKMAVHLDETIRLLAMSPWVRVASAARAQQEDKAVAGLAPAFANVMPPFMRAVERVWAGERDQAVLTALLCEHIPDEDHDIAAVLVQQLLDCTEQLEKAVGKPDKDGPVLRRVLVNSVTKVARMTDYVKKHQV